ncbi:MAG TPA: tripartite tricarboxylate transporter substrate binding protein [Burkholderiales bacterium]|nr:tripartite tricarboxylate transporter substrate binding protein [Burkholderiales bacterium]
MKHALWKAASLVSAVVFGTPCALAQTFPSRPISMIVPYAAGGSADVVGRLVATEMSKTLGHNVILELKPGAGGNIGAELVAKTARADGYTILLGSLSLSSNPSLMKLNFDPRKDLVAVAGIATLPNLMVTAANGPIRSIQEAIAAAKQKPGELTFGSSGPGTSSHLTGELLKAAAGIDMTHVPYKGSGAVYPDLISGRVNFLFDLAGSAMGYVQGGKVRALATTSIRRSSALPDVPTVAESGYPGFEFGAYLAVFAPSATPKEAIAILEDAIAKAIQAPVVKKRLTLIAAEPVPVSAAGFQKYFNDDVERFTRLVREGKLQPLR